MEEPLQSSFLFSRGAFSFGLGLSAEAQTQVTTDVFSFTTSANDHEDLAQAIDAQGPQLLRSRIEAVTIVEEPAQAEAPQQESSLLGDDAASRAELGEFIELPTAEKTIATVARTTNTELTDQALEELGKRPYWMRWCKHIRSPFLRLHQEIVELVELLQPTEEEIDNRRQAVKELTDIVQSIWPSAKVKVFGSFATGLFVPTSDVDCVVMDSQCTNIQEGLKALHAVIMRKQIAKNAQVIAKARVPIVKYECTGWGGLNFDVSFDMANGPESAKLVYEFTAKWPMMRPLVLILKLFLQQRELNEVYSGGIGSYALITLVAAFLKLHTSRRPKASKTTDKKRPRSSKTPSAALLEPSLGVLLVDFFRLFGRVINMSEVGLSATGTGFYFRKDDMDDANTGGTWLNPDRPNLLAAQDPKDETNDVCRGSYNIRIAKAAFDFAYLQLTAPTMPDESLLAKILRLGAILVSRRPPENPRDLYLRPPPKFGNDSDDEDKGPDGGDGGGDEDDDAGGSGGGGGGRSKSHERSRRDSDREGTPKQRKHHHHHHHHHGSDGKRRSKSKGRDKDTNGSRGRDGDRKRGHAVMADGDDGDSSDMALSDVEDSCGALSPPGLNCTHDDGLRRHHLKLSCCGSPHAAAEATVMPPTWSVPALPGTTDDHGGSDVMEISESSGDREEQNNQHEHAGLARVDHAPIMTIATTDIRPGKVPFESGSPFGQGILAHGDGMGLLAETQANAVDGGDVPGGHIHGDLAVEVAGAGVNQGAIIAASGAQEDQDEGDEEDDDPSDDAEAARLLEVQAWAARLLASKQQKASQQAAAEPPPQPVPDAVAAVPQQSMLQGMSISVLQTQIGTMNQHVQPGGIARQHSGTISSHQDGQYQQQQQSMQHVGSMLAQQLSHGMNQQQHSGGMGQQQTLQDVVVQQQQQLNQQHTAPHAGSVPHAVHGSMAPAEHAVMLEAMSAGMPPMLVPGLPGPWPVSLRPVLDPLMPPDVFNDMFLPPPELFMMMMGGTNPNPFLFNNQQATNQHSISSTGQQQLQGQGHMQDQQQTASSPDTEPFIHKIKSLENNRQKRRQMLFQQQAFWHSSQQGQSPLSPPLQQQQRQKQIQQKQQLRQHKQLQQSGQQQSQAGQHAQLGGPSGGSVIKRTEPKKKQRSRNKLAAMAGLRVLTETLEVQASAQQGQQEGQPQQAPSQQRLPQQQLPRHVQPEPQTSMLHNVVLQPGQPRQGHGQLQSLPQTEQSANQQTQRHTQAFHNHPASQTPLFNATPPVHNWPPLLPSQEHIAHLPLALPRVPSLAAAPHLGALA